MKTGVLLVNVGSPNSPHIADVRRYLAEFLMDPNILDIPYLLRFALVHGIILRTRPKKSAEAYEKIWTENGSPLVAITRKLATQLTRETGLPVAVGMRYQNPSIQAGLIELYSQEVRKILVIPMFPQFAMSTTGGIQGYVKTLAHAFGDLSVDILPPFFNDPAYISALSNSIQPYLKNPFDHLLISFHGLPERHLRKTDPTKRHCLATENCCDKPSSAHQSCYRHQARTTVNAIERRLGIPANKISMSYQSRLGRDAWLQPYTESELKRLAKSGVKNLVVACPAFVTDCLETLEEIGMSGKETFLSAGGKSFTLVPCLNTDSAWVETLKYWIQQRAKHYAHQ